MRSASVTELGWIGVLLVVISFPGIAAAQGEKALAQALFDEGRALMREGNYEKACPKLAESNRLDAAIGTLLNLALCHEEEGKTATAWSEYEEALGAARKQGDAKREQFAKDRIAKLRPRLSRVTISVPAANEVPGLEVTRNGILLQRPSWGSGLPMNPGVHASPPPRPVMNAGK